MEIFAWMVLNDVNEAQAAAKYKQWLVSGYDGTGYFGRIIQLRYDLHFVNETFPFASINSALAYLEGATHGSIKCKVVFVEAESPILTIKGRPIVSSGRYRSFVESPGHVGGIVAHDQISETDYELLVEAYIRTVIARRHLKKVESYWDELVGKLRAVSYDFDDYDQLARVRPLVRKLYAKLLYATEELTALDVSIASKVKSTSAVFGAHFST